MHGSCSAAAVTAAIFHRRAALACPLVISCNRSTLSTHYGLFKVSTGGRRGEARRGEERGEGEDDRGNKEYVWEE